VNKCTLEGTRTSRTLPQQLIHYRPAAASPSPLLQAADAWARPRLLLCV